ncbi:hypothetical protein QQF64_012520 [Cirrhinus molitorella]|uniref:Uncharacterized protein n=1 Tax=Cirrhinus molitorella TaxID=172907 RepID=A0ABR3LXF5_9TELE
MEAVKERGRRRKGIFASSPQKTSFFCSSTLSLISPSLARTGAAGQKRHPQTLIPPQTASELHCQCPFYRCEMHSSNQSLPRLLGGWEQSLNSG